MISFSQPAIDEIARQIAKRGLSDTRFRIGVRGGGCSGFSYVVEFHEGEPNEDDHSHRRAASDGSYVTILVDKKSETLLQDTTVDWEDTLMRRGFVFRNSNAKSTCGCGASFSA